MLTHGGEVAWGLNLKKVKSLPEEQVGGVSTTRGEEQAERVMRDHMLRVLARCPADYQYKQLAQSQFHNPLTTLNTPTTTMSNRYPSQQVSDKQPKLAYVDFRWSVQGESKVS